MFFAFFCYFCVISNTATALNAKMLDITEGPLQRVTNRIFGIRDFPYLKLGIRDLKTKSGRDSGLKVYARGGIPKITLGITGLHEILGRDCGIEEPYWGPSLQIEIPFFL